MLSPALETYRGNRFALTQASLWFLVSVGGLGAAQAYKPLDWQYLEMIAVALIGISAFFLCWLLTVRIGLHPDGISVQSFLGRKEVRWDEVDRFYYSAIQQRVNGIPAGTYYTFRLIDRQGTKISLGHTVERPEQFGTKLIQFTQKPLLTRAIGHYNSGVEVSFGPVKVSRTDGITIRTLTLKKKMALNQVASYRIERGKFYIFSRGEKRSGGTEIRTIPNAFALLGLLDAILKPVPARPPAPPTPRPALSRT
ncbi:MAG TPA: DUF6585 family protein [Candidatus Acidoferrum sp.]|nr:DUF6585 family protein [Candidatus Acidoferrum sp.]